MTFVVFAELSKSRSDRYQCESLLEGFASRASRDSVGDGGGAGMKLLLS